MPATSRSASNYEAVEGRLRRLAGESRFMSTPAIGDGLPRRRLRDLVSTFDDKIFPTPPPGSAPAVDVDQDGRFTVLFSSWLTRLAGGKAWVNGFVRGADLDLEPRSTVRQPLRHDLPEHEP